MNALPLITACIYLGALTPDHKNISFGSDIGELLRYQDAAVKRGILRHKLI